MTTFQRARSAEQQHQRRAAILRAARTTLERLPLAEVSLRELAREVGLSKSNVVRYFPTREAVFLAVLVDDWAGWLDELEASLPRRDRRRSPATTYRLMSTAVATTLAARPRMCDLLSSCEAVLERNVPLETAREFKTAALAHLQRFAAMMRACAPHLDEAAAFEFAGITWALAAGAWPMANPAPVIATVLAEPGYDLMTVRFESALTSALTALLQGLTGRVDPSQ